VSIIKVFGISIASFIGGVVFSYSFLSNESRHTKTINRNTIEDSLSVAVDHSNEPERPTDDFLHPSSRANSVKAKPTQSNVLPNSSNCRLSEEEIIQMAEQIHAAKLDETKNVLESNWFRLNDIKPEDYFLTAQVSHESLKLQIEIEDFIYNSPIGQKLIDDYENFAVESIECKDRVCRINFANDLRNDKLQDIYFLMMENGVIPEYTSYRVDHTEQYLWLMLPKKEK
jgi:hypothetical protein